MMLTIEDVLNGWLQENWPTLYAKTVFFPESVCYGTGELTVIARKGSNNWVLTFWPSGEVNTQSANKKWSVGSSANPEFLDRVNGALLRVCAGKDLR